LSQSNARARSSTGLRLSTSLRDPRTPEGREMDCDDALIDGVISAFLKVISCFAIAHLRSPEFIHLSVFRRFLLLLFS
jgi:hypothetical protein